MQLYYNEICHQKNTILEPLQPLNKPQNSVGITAVDATT
jgi:hypothetical protein